MIKELKELLQSGEYDSLSDQEVADALNAEITESCEYMLTDIRLAALIGTVKAVTVIEAFKANGDAVSNWIVEKLATTGLDIGNAEAPYLIQPLVDNGVVTQGEADVVLSMGMIETTKAKQVGINNHVLDVHVAEARR